MDNIEDIENSAESPRCSTCGKKKPIGAFTSDINPSQRRSTCDACRAARSHSRIPISSQDRVFRTPLAVLSQGPATSPPLTPSHQQTQRCPCCKQNRPLSDFIGVRGRPVQRCRHCRPRGKENTAAGPAGAASSSKRLEDDASIQKRPVKRRRLARDTRDGTPTDVFPHGRNPEDSPRTAAARAERARTRRENRTARRGGEDVNSTPPLAVFVARQSPVEDPLVRLPMTRPQVEEPPVHRPQVEDDSPVHPGSQSNPPVTSSPRASPGSPRPGQPPRRGQQHDPQAVRQQGGPVTLREDPPYDLQDPNHFSLPALSPEDEARRQEFLKALDEVQMTTCSRCKERWFDMKLKESVCHRCERHDSDNRRNGVVFLWSAENDMDPGEVDAALPVLTQTEEMLIARVHVYVEVRQIRGAQYRYTGNVVNFYRKSSALFAKLPQLPENIDVLILKPSNTNTSNRLQRQFSHDHHVRRRCILQWLRYLKDNHPGYRDVEIDFQALNQLPEDGDISDRLQTLEIDPTEAQPQPATALENVGPQLPQPEELDTAATAVDADVEYNVVPDVRPDISDLEYLREAVGTDAPPLSIPSIHATPINEYDASDKTLSLAFPTLYPTGAADFKSPRRRTVEYGAYIEHLMRYKDGRFCSTSAVALRRLQYKAETSG